MPPPQPLAAQLATMQLDDQHTLATDEIDTRSVEEESRGAAEPDDADEWLEDEGGGAASEEGETDSDGADLQDGGELYCLACHKRFKSQLQLK